MINGIRADPSKKLILYQSPRSPSMSPWSARSTTTVSSPRPSSSSVSTNRAVQSSTYDTLPRYGAPRGPHVIIGDDRGGRVDRRPQPRRMWIVGLHVGGRHRRHRDLDALIAIPVATSRHIRIVRMGEAGDQHERSIVVGAGQVMECLHGVVADLVVEPQLIRHLRHPRPGDAVHVVVPPVDAVVRRAPIRCPAEVSGIDVGGAP